MVPGNLLLPMGNSQGVNMVSATAWAKKRNLKLQQPEALLYVLCRAGKEELPSEVWVYLADRSYRFLRKSDNIEA